MISIPAPEAGAIKLIGGWGGEAAGLLQPTVETVRGPGGFQLALEWEGDYGSLASFQAGPWCEPGCPGLPGGLSMLDAGEAIKLESSTLRLEEGYTGVLRNTYVKRTERETDADMVAGLVSRTSSMQWVERQEQIEHFAARIPDGEMGRFNPTLLEMWRAEECADVKAEFKVRLYTEDSDGLRTYADTVALDNADAALSEQLRGSALTKAIAQRIAQGVEYAGSHMLQVVVREVWRKPPMLTHQCNAVLPQGIPLNHAPLFTLSSAVGEIKWMRLSDDCEQTEAGAYLRSVVYLGLPTTMMPNPPPDGWGTRPFDALLYKEAE